MTPAELDAMGLRVRPLAWVKHQSVDAWRAETSIGTYQVWGIKPQPTWQFDGWSSRADKEYATAKSVEAAKSACEANHAARIAASLEVKP
jgi:hypothetical protein